MSQCQTFEFCDSSRFLSHKTYFVTSHVEKSQMSQTQSLYKSLFRRSANIQLRFRSIQLRYICSFGFEATIRSDKPMKTQESWYWPRLRSSFWILLGTTLSVAFSVEIVTTQVIVKKNGNNCQKLLLSKVVDPHAITYTFICLLLNWQSLNVSSCVCMCVSKFANKFTGTTRCFGESSTLFIQYTTGIIYAEYTYICMLVNIWQFPDVCCSVLQLCLSS